MFDWLFKKSCKYPQSQHLYIAQLLHEKKVIQDRLSDIESDIKSLKHDMTRCKLSVAGWASVYARKAKKDAKNKSTRVHKESFD